jgi:hypothetical protein
MKWVALAVAAAAMALAPASASAGQGGSGGSDRDSAVGTGENAIGRVSFAAHAGRSPLDPVTGHFTARGELAELGSTEVGAFRFEGPVTCLTVSGNRAGLFYPIKNATPAVFEGQGVFVFLEDNGNPEGGGDPDRIGFVGPVPVPADPVLCPPAATPFPLREGNVTVHDAP